MAQGELLRFEINSEQFEENRCNEMRQQVTKGKYSYGKVEL
jgi:hypothetical protein